MGVLAEFGFDKILQNAYQSLIETGKQTSNISVTGRSAYAMTISSTLLHVNQKLATLSEFERITVKKLIAEIVSRILLELIRELELELKVFIPEFNKIIEASCLVFGFDYSDFQAHINTSELIALSEDLSGTTEANQLTRTKKNTIAWQVSPNALSEMIHLIKQQRAWTRKPARLFKLFANPTDDLAIFWNDVHHAELAFLLSDLHGKEIIGCYGNRGLFSAVEKHLYNFNNEKITPGTLKNLSHRIKKNWLKYEQRMRPVIQVIAAVEQTARN